VLVLTKINKVKEKAMLGILWGIFVIVIAFWLIGLVFNILGGAIHFLLVVAALILLYNLFVAGKNRVAP
jgi:hypothetical protein